MHIYPNSGYKLRNSLRKSYPRQPDTEPQQESVKFLGMLIFSNKITPDLGVENRLFQDPCLTTPKEL